MESYGISWLVCILTMPDWQIPPGENMIFALAISPQSRLEKLDLPYVAEEACFKINHLTACSWELPYRLHYGILIQKHLIFHFQVVPISTQK